MHAILSDTAEPVTSTRLDESSFIIIYNKYWEKLFVIAYNRLSSRQAAEDVVQEVMLGLWQRKTEVMIDDLEAWLSAATRYSVFRQLAKFGHQKFVDLSFQGEKGYSQDFDSGFINEILREQVNLLPRKCKAVFTYSRQHELSNKEIAQKLSISEKTVEKHMTTALFRLKEKFKRMMSL